ncbi:MAG: PAS domain S-box protein [Anaerolineales bacterium]|nr:PAS domain S-box protein [Anaerolineales bacterium]
MQNDLLTELQESEARFRAAFQSSAIGMGLLALDGRILQVNDAVVRMSGYSEEELLQRYDSDNVYPEDRHIGMDLYQELLNGKRDSFQVEKRYVRKSQDIVWMRLTLSAVRNPDNSPVYLVGMIEDIDQQKRILAELEESEARFRATFASSAIGIALTTLDGHLLSANAAICKMSGYTEKELKTRTDFENTYPEDRAVGMGLLSELLEGRRNSYQAQKRYIRKNGEIFWAQVTLSAVQNSAGKLDYLVAMVEDINEQKQALEELHRSQARFQAIFKDSAVGMGVMGLDRRIIDANPAICRMYGMTREEMIGMSAAEVTYPEDNPQSTQLLNELVSGQRNSYEIDRRYIRRNGEVFWAHVTMSSVRGLDGTPLYLVGMVIDIDEQKKMQERIRESEARFQAIFDNVAVGVAVMTLQRQPIAINAQTEKITGYSLEDLAGVNPVMLAIPEDRNMDTDMFKDLVEGRRNSYVMERRYRHKDGHIFWARINYSLVRDRNGNPDYLVGIIEDIDDQKRVSERLAEQEADYLRMLQQRVHERTQELEQINQRLQQEIEQRIRIEQELASKAAEEAVTADRTRLARDLHDAVTQTLFSASLTAEVLPDLWEMDVDEAKRSTEELRQLTRGALAEMRTLLLELRPAALTQTRLSDLIRQLCEAFIGRSRLPISLTIEGERDLPPEVQIACYRVAQESLNNVFKYARATQVNVGLFLSATGLRFEVCDNGIGFDMSASKPTSLGMRIMRERAEAIGADLYISSTPGSGTCLELIWDEKPNFKLRVL